MRVEDLKRWHWILIGLVLGLIGAWVEITIGPEAIIVGPHPFSIAEQQFERDLVAPAIQGHPVLSNIKIYPLNAETDLLTMWRLQPVDPAKKGSKELKQQYTRFNAPRPYSALSGPLQTKMTLSPAWGKMGIRMTGWENGRGEKWRDPGPEEGSEVRFDLWSGGSYQVHVRVLNAAKPDDLKASLNGQKLPPFQADLAHPDEWQTTVPAAALRTGINWQRLDFSRGETPVQIREIEVVDPTFTVRQYLDELKVKNPQVSYRFAWWMQPRAIILGWIIGCLIVIGGIWPTIINLLVSQGFGRPPRDKDEYDLSRFKGEPKPQAATAKVTNSNSLEELEGSLLKSLEDDDAARAGEPVVAAPAPIRQLNAAPPPATPAPVRSKEEEKDFTAGEFYPVARGPKKQD